MVAVNNVLQIDENDSSVISSSELEVVDEDNSPDELVFNITTQPVQGRLELSTDPGVAISTFTQEDIDNDRIVYVHDGSESPTETFAYTVDDGVGTVTSGSFTLSVAPVNDAPQVVSTVMPNVLEGGTVVIDSSHLQIFDPDNVASELIVEITNRPNNGYLALVTEQATEILSFTQQQVSDGLVVFVHNGNEPAAEGFQFSIRDIHGASVGGPCVRYKCGCCQ